MNNTFTNINISILGNYTKIETLDTSICINTDIEKIEIKKEDNGKPIILVESKQ